MRWRALRRDGSKPCTQDFGGFREVTKLRETPLKLPKSSRRYLKPRGFRARTQNTRVFFETPEVSGKESRAILMIRLNPPKSRIKTLRESFSGTPEALPYEMGRKRVYGPSCATRSGIRFAALGVPRPVTGSQPVPAA